MAICDAAEQLSDTRTGALMVLERNNNLDEIIRTGTPMHADVIPEMLGTIFYEGTPCTTAQSSSATASSRPQAVCCPFPTTWTWAKTWVPATARLPRHAENSDAIAIVVSEKKTWTARIICDGEERYPC